MYSVGSITASTAALRHLTRANMLAAESMTRIASGQRILRASDDPTAFIRSQRLRSEVDGTTQAIRNAQEGIGMIDTVDAAVTELQDMLQRLRVLALDASNTALTDGTAQDLEAQELLTQITALGVQTQYNGQAVFADFLAVPITFHVGPRAGAAHQIVFNHDLGLSAANVFGVDLSGIDLAADAAGALTAIDSALDAVTPEQAYIGGVQQRFERTITMLTLSRDNLADAERRLTETDIAAETVALTRQQLLADAAMAMIAQANAASHRVLDLLR